MTKPAKSKDMFEQRTAPPLLRGTQTAYTGIWTKQPGRIICNVVGTTQLAERIRYGLDDRGTVLRFMARTRDIPVVQSVLQTGPLGPTRHCNERVLRYPPWGYRDRRVDVTIYVLTVPRLRIRGSRTSTAS